MAAIVQASNLSKVFHLGDERVHALRDVSLEIFPGEMVAIVGQVGSGKSTLLHSLASLQETDSGEVQLMGLQVSGIKSRILARVRAHKVGFLFQAFNLLPDKSVLANVEVSLLREGIGARAVRQKALEALRAVGLEGYQESMPGQLSADQRLTVVMARELVHDPEVLFADEPTQVLDSSSTETVMGLFQKLNSEGMTVIIATSDREIASYCRRVMGMENGVVTDEGLVPRRRIIRLSRPLIPSRDTSFRETEVVCTRCNYGNHKDLELCQRCRFPLRLTEDEERYVEGRLMGEESRWGGVESASDEGEVPGQELVSELKEIPFFSEIGSKSLVKVIPSLEERVFPRGSTVIKQGDPGDSFYIIRRGTVRIMLERPDRPVVTVAQLGPKEGFGEMALLTEQPRSASVVAMTDIEAWCLPKAAFAQLLSENLSLALYFNRILTQRLRTLQEELIP